VSQSEYESCLRQTLEITLQLFCEKHVPIWTIQFIAPFLIIIKQMIARSIDITYPKAFTRDAIGTFRADLKLIPHTGERWMRPMFDLDPAIEPAGAIAALAVFGNQAFEPHQAGVPE
jgi:hypothetical protein